ncbi:MAG: hypothetical protein ABH825_04710 [Candidatus Omnitrophota bacterium]
MKAKERPSRKKIFSGIAAAAPLVAAAAALICAPLAAARPCPDILRPLAARESKEDTFLLDLLLDANDRIDLDTVEAYNTLFSGLGDVSGKEILLAGDFPCGIPTALLLKGARVVFVHPEGPSGARERAFASRHGKGRDLTAMTWVPSEPVRKFHAAVLHENIFVNTTLASRQKILASALLSLDKDGTAFIPGKTVRGVKTGPLAEVQAACARHGYMAFTGSEGFMKLPGSADLCPVVMINPQDALEAYQALANSPYNSIFAQERLNEILKDKLSEPFTAPVASIHDTAWRVLKKINACLSKKQGYVDIFDMRMLHKDALDYWTEQIMAYIDKVEQIQLSDRVGLADSMKDALFEKTGIGRKSINRIMEMPEREEKEKTVFELYKRIAELKYKDTLKMMQSSLRSWLVANQALSPSIKEWLDMEERLLQVKKMADQAAAIRELRYQI